MARKKKYDLSGATYHVRVKSEGYPTRDIRVTVYNGPTEDKAIYQAINEFRRDNKLAEDVHCSGMTLMSPQYF